MNTNANDEGSVIVLGLGYIVIVLLVLLTMFTLANLYVQRTKFADLADQVALKAADNITESYYYGQSENPNQSFQEAQLAQGNWYANQTLSRVQSEGEYRNLTNLQISKLAIQNNHTEVTLRGNLNVKNLGPFGPTLITKELTINSVAQINKH